MKNTHKTKTPFHMSRSAFQAHAHKQSSKVQEAFFLHRNDAQYIARVVLKNPLGVVSTFGLFNDLDEATVMCAAAATITFDMQFGHFTNLDCERYLAVFVFLAGYAEELKENGPAEMAQVKNDCYEWLYGGDAASINPEIKAILTESLTQAKISAEQEEFNKSVPIFGTQQQKTATFKI